MNWWVCLNIFTSTKRFWVLISKLNSYIDKNSTQENILTIVTNKRILDVCEINNDYVYFTSLISVHKLNDLLINFFLIVKSLNLNKSTDKLQLVGIIPRIRLSIYLAMSWLEYDTFLDYFYNNKSIKDIYCATAIHHSSYLMLQASKISSIRSTVVQHGYPMDKVGSLPIDSTYFAVYDQKAAEVFRTWGVDNIIDFDLNKISAQKKVMQANDEVLVCLSSWGHDNNQIFCHLMEYFLEHDSTCIFRIRKHPGSFQISKYQNLWVNNTLGVQFDNYNNCQDSIRNSKCVITSYSSVIQEASDLKVPVILISDLVTRSNFNFPNMYNIESYLDFKSVLKRLVIK